MKEPRFNFRKEYLMIAEKFFITDKEKTDFLKAIIRYGLFKEEPNFTETLNTLFSLIKIIIDNDREFTDSLPDLELPSERESSAKEKEFPSFDEMKPVQCTVDDPNPLTLDDFIQLTEDLIRQGMTNDIGINKKQQEVLGVESLHKGWMQELIGKIIHINKYNEFLNLKGATSK